MNLSYTPRQHQLYPETPPITESCPVNQVYKTLPKDWPRERRLLGPAATAKHIYGTGTPNCYPYMYRDVPVDTMYENDLDGISYISGVAPDGRRYGPYPKRHFYHFRAYPFHHHYAHEVRRYRDYILPYPDARNWTKHPVVTP